MQSLHPKFLKSLALNVEHATTLKTLGEFKGKQALFKNQTPQILESLQRAAIIESVESSNRLEGVTAPDKRLEAIVLKSTTPANRSEQEIAGYRDALNQIHESATYMPFSVNVILQLHSVINRYLPDSGGKWKMTANEIVERNPDGSVHRVRFTPVEPVRTPQAMEDFVRLHRDATQRDLREPLVVVPLTILDFLCIHPFADGNGRVSRLLTLLLLYHFGYEVGRFISLERIFEESKETYYETLERSSRGWHQGRHDVFPWMTYFWGVLLAAYKEFEERVGRISTGRGAKTDMIRDAVARRMQPFNISDIERDCPGVSRDMIRVVLRAMRDQGIVAMTGKGRGAKWIRTQT